MSSPNQVVGGLGKITLVSMCTAFISMLSSITIIIMILRSDRGLSKLYHRLIFGLSTSDIIQSFAMSFGTLPSPRGTDYVWMPIGNTASCSAQGFLFFAGALGALLYTCSTCIYYYLCIKHRMTEDQIAEKVEKYLHLTSIIFPLLGATTGLTLQVFNPDMQFCGLQSSPLNCYLKKEAIEDEYGEMEEQQCRGGPFVRIVMYAFHSSALFLAVVVITFTMTKIYRAVKEQEERSAEFNFPGRVDSAAAQSRKVWVRAISYVLALVVSYFPMLLANYVQRYTGRTIKTLFIIAGVLYPSQGLYNLLIFVHVSVSKKRKEMNISYIPAFIITCKTFGRRDGTENVEGAQGGEIEAFGFFSRIKRRIMSLLQNVQESLLLGLSTSHKKNGPNPVENCSENEQEPHFEQHGVLDYENQSSNGYQSRNERKQTVPNKSEGTHNQHESKNSEKFVDSSKGSAVSETQSNGYQCQDEEKEDLDHSSVESNDDERRIQGEKTSY